MSLQFHRAVENMDVWSASSADISFVISFVSPAGSGFHGRPGFVASWRPLYSSTGAIEITGSPLETFADAEGACNAILRELKRVSLACCRAHYCPVRRRSVAANAPAIEIYELPHVGHERLPLLWC